MIPVMNVLTALIAAVNSSGAFLMIPSTSSMTISAAVPSSSGSSFDRSVIRVVIICVAAFMICGRLSLIPFSRDFRIFIPALASCGISFVNAEMISGISAVTASTNTGSCSVIALATDATAEINPGRRFVTSSVIFGIISGAAVEMNSAIPLIAVSTTGRRLFINPPPSSPPKMVYSRLFTAVSISSPAPVIEIRRFCHAAFVACADPESVYMASFAVVPVIPISC